MEVLLWFAYDRRRLSFRAIARKSSKRDRLSAGVRCAWQLVAVYLLGPLLVCSQKHVGRVVCWPTLFRKNAPFHFLHSGEICRAHVRFGSFINCEGVRRFYFLFS